MTSLWQVILREKNMKKFVFYRKLFGYKKGDFPIAESVSERTIALPFYNNLGEKEINYVVENLKRFLRKC